MHHVSTLLRQLTLTHSVPRLLQSSGGPKGRRSRRPPPSCTWSCSVGGRRQAVWPEGHLRPVLDVVGPVLSLSPASAASLDVALKGGFGEGVAPHDVAKPRLLSSPHGCQERFLGTHQALDTVVGFVSAFCTRCGEVSSGTWSPMPGFFSRRPPSESMSHIRRAGWRQPVTWTAGIWFGSGCYGE